MTQTEITTFMRMLKALRPSQSWDETSDLAWTLPLEDLAFDDAREALKRLSKTHKWIGSDDVCKLVDDIVAKRMARAIIPAGDPDDPGRYRDEVRASIERFAKGAEMPPGIASLTTGGAVSGQDRPDSYQRMRAEQTGHSREFLAEREAANTVACEHCKSPIGTTCVSGVGGLPLSRVTAHEPRLVAVGLAELTPVVTPNEFLALLRSQGVQGA